MTQSELINKYTERIMIDYPEVDKIHIDLMQFAEELRQCNVSGRSEQLEAKRKDFCLWYYAQSQPLDANKIVEWFASNYL